MLTFYRFDKTSGLNTFSSEEVNKWIAWKEDLSIQDMIKVNTISLNAIINKYCGDVWPDFMDVDVEGLDYDILSDANWGMEGPKVILVEVREIDERKFDTLMETKGYTKYCRIWGNNFYIRTDMFGLVVRQNINDMSKYFI